MTTTGRKRPPRGPYTVELPQEDAERLEEFCMRRALQSRPFREVAPSSVARFAVLKYLEEAETREGYVRGARRKNPPCLAADCLGGLRWCPEHDARWRDGDEVPESCRGDA